MSGFAAGVLAGICLYKAYDSTVKEEEDNKPNPDFINSVSRATELNRTTANFYNEAADDTSGATHVNFLSDVVARLWPYLSKAGAESIKMAIEPTFRETLPSPLSTLKFRKLELGDVPLVLDNILVRELRKIDDDGCAYGENHEYLQFEWDVTWRSDCDIELATDKIAGMAAIVFGIKTLMLSGRLRVIAKPLSGSFPCIDAVQFAFVNPPKVNIDFTGLANVADFNLKVAGVSVLDIRGIVRGVVDDILGKSMVLPNQVVAPVTENVKYWNAYCPSYKGLARVRLHSGRGFEIQKASTPFGKDDIPDVYVKIRLGVEDFFESSVCKDNCNPKWNPEEEFHDFLFCSGRDQIFEIQAWDRDTGTLDPDDFLGITYVTIGQALLDADRNGLFEVELMTKKTNTNNAKPTGQYITISVDKLPFTTKNLESMNPMVISNRPSHRDVSNMSARQRKIQERKDGARLVGLLTIVVSHAVNLPFAKDAEANTFVKVFLGAGPTRKEIGVTPTIPDTLCPDYMTPFDLPITVKDVIEWGRNPANKCITFVVFYQNPKNEKAKPKPLGEIKVDESEIIKGNESSLRALRSIGKHTHSKLAFTVAFAGVQDVPEKSKLEREDSGLILSGDSNTAILESRDTTDKSIEVVSMKNSMGSLSGNQKRILIRIVKGYGFRTEKKGRFKKADIPDVYCLIKYGSQSTEWRTKTIKDSETPEWDNEQRKFTMESMNEVISIDVWDENRKGHDDYYGNARTSIGKVLLNNGTLDVEIRNDHHVNTDADILKAIAKPILRAKKRLEKKQMYIRVQCQKL